MVNDSTWNAGAESESFEGKSRSHKKRESTALQKKGEELVALGPGIWKILPLPMDLAAALVEFKGMKNHEAKRRQMQYIGRLMRETDEEAMQALLSALEGLQTTSRSERDRLHRLESLRDALLSSEASVRESALPEALAASPSLNEARLRHLIEAALADREKQRPPKHARELFRYLREGIE